MSQANFSFISFSSHFRLRKLFWGNQLLPEGQTSAKFIFGHEGWIGSVWCGIWLALLRKSKENDSGRTERRCQKNWTGPSSIKPMLACVICTVTYFSALWCNYVVTLVIAWLQLYVTIHMWQCTMCTHLNHTQPFTNRALTKASSLDFILYPNYSCVIYFIDLQLPYDVRWLSDCAFNILLLGLLSIISEMQLVPPTHIFV